MADIEIVIKIPENVYKHIQKHSTEMQAEGFILENAVLNGTPLPKGHGDLKDIEDIYEALEAWNNDTCWIVDAIDCLVQPIIEADKEALD